MRPLAKGCLAAFVAATLLSSAAHAITWDFISAGDPASASAGTNTLTFVSSGISLTVKSFALHSLGDTNYGHVATLWRRNQPTNDVGLGVCNHGETIPDCIEEGGSFNELDNSGPHFDVIRVNLTDLTPLILQSAGLSSVDGNADKYKIFGSNLENPALVPSASVFQLASGDNTGGTNPNVPLSGTFKFLYFTTDPARPDDSSPTFTGGNYLVRSLTATVPEPGALLLLGSGLAGMAGAAWRRHRRGAAHKAS